MNVFVKQIERHNDPAITGMFHDEHDFVPFCLVNIDGWTSAPSREELVFLLDFLSTSTDATDYFYLVKRGYGRNGEIKPGFGADLLRIARELPLSSEVVRIPTSRIDRIADAVHCCWRSGGGHWLFWINERGAPLATQLAELRNCWEDLKAACGQLICTSAGVAITFDDALIDFYIPKTPEDVNRKLLEVSGRYGINLKIDRAK